MYDELIKRLREGAISADSGNEISESLYRDILQAADAIEELENQIVELNKMVPKWIPVTERLPDAEERVLCYCRANIYEVMKMRTDGDWVYDTNHIYMRSFVTHWMPLPEPPQEET